MDGENNNFLKIYDSSGNHSRKTLKYICNPETDILGQGGFGKVYKVKIEKEFQNESKTYAIKIFPKEELKNDEDKANSVLNEIKIHRSLVNEHICKYEHSFEDKDNVYIVMEYCPDGTLLNLLKKRKRLEEIEIRFYMYQVLKVLKYFRFQKLIHRDLTLKNIFLNNYKIVKISDFGLAYRECEIEETECIICGTPGYFTPESNLGKYSYKTDIFCFGMCIYYLFGGKTIFNTSQESYEFFSHRLFEPEITLKLSNEALDLIKKLISIDSKRISLDKIFEHPFFNNGKGLEIENFPDYKDKNYFNKIKELSNKFNIRPIDIKKFKRNNKNNNILNMIESNGLSSGSSSNKEKNSSNRIKFSNKISFGQSLFNGYNFQDENEKKDFNKENNKNEYKYEYGSNIKDYFNKRKKNKICLNDIIYIVNTYNKAKDKFGIGYKLNNKNIGFIFNDDSQLTKINKNDEFLFYHKKDLETKNIENLLINLPPKNISNEIVSKIKILYQIENDLNKARKKYFKNKNIINDINEDIYVQKYQSGYKCFIFLMSNKNIQVNFFDGNIVLFNYFPKALIFLSNNEINTINIFPLQKDQNFSDVYCENESINNKIKCALEEIKK